jgi:NAD(P)-dependent dehydrogenase (short-subunit alcohol dehydrogenase family)
MSEAPVNVADLLKGRIFLVTGAGQGNGRAIALGVARSGAKVAVTDVQVETAENTARDIRASGGEAMAFHLDVTDPGECERVAERIGSEMGLLDVLVNNAGIIIRENIDSPKAHENWRRTMDVNVNGSFNVVHACLAQLRKTRGSIINVASIASFVGVADTLGYSPSKGAVKLFTQALARELAADGIRVNALAPGVIETPMTRSTRDDPDRLAGFLRRTPLGRVGQPEELVGPVVFLASAMASYVNGVILPVDGGFLAV